MCTNATYNSLGGSSKARSALTITAPSNEKNPVHPFCGVLPHTQHAHKQAAERACDEQ